MVQRNGSSSIETLRHAFVVPDYYKDFTCKGPSCRATCCAGWGVTIPMQQYFTLLGLACDRPLRTRLDRTFRPLADATPERYAEIAHDYYGKCPLHLENGYCRLQQQCGEDVLPAVCRYYPRGPRTDYAFECACSNSCEKTLELLFAKPDRITFETRELAFRMVIPARAEARGEETFYARVRAYCFAVLSDRALSLPTRIAMIGKLLLALDADRGADLGAVDLTVPDFPRDIPFTYRVLMSVARAFGDRHRSIAEACRDNETFYADGDLAAKYDAAAQHFETVLPDHEILFEKMIVNDLFLRQFPFGDAARDFYGQFVALCGSYLFLRYLSIALMRDRNTIADFVDIAAKAYRVIAHSRFERNVAIHLADEDATAFETLGVLLQA